MSLIHKQLYQGDLNYQPSGKLSPVWEIQAGHMIRNKRTSGIWKEHLDTDNILGILSYQHPQIGRVS